MGRRSVADRGFTIAEVLIAMMLIAVAAIGVAEVFGASIRATNAARVRTDAARLASQKMEQLLSLTWRFDRAGLGLSESDTTSDLSYDPPRSGGAGLSPSPAGTLDANVAGYVDFTDASGGWVGQGAAVPPSAVYLRRWRVAPLALDPLDSIVLQVLVRAVSAASPSAAADVVLTSVRTRKAA